MVLKLARSLGSVLVVAWALAIGAGAASAAPAIDAVEVAGGLDEPVAFTFGPGKQIWYVEKSTGEIRVIDLDGGSDDLFETVSGVDGSGERGMLGIALHPDYPNEPFVYVYVTRTVGGALRNQILRIRDRDGSGGAETVVFSSIAGRSPYHNGGRIAFGPDGKLYAIVGDAHDPANAQDLSEEDRGKIIRITPSGDVPGNNPFGDRVWAFGIRNSFGFDFNPEDGVLWETENGPSCNDEVNLIRRGWNYGWGPNATCEGSSPGNTNQDGPDPARPELFFENPVGITGIAFCDGCQLGRRSEGAAFFGAVNNGEVTRMILTDSGAGVARRSVIYDHGSSTLSFEVGPGGRIFLSDFDGIYKLVRRR
ncbi:MAG TPA: PQQ-dependent sugar dehydrogenase [Actinomycetota bacterium]|nr:PQQ-dependent sugar dehydrogenase [Actinomycetota bacterium]